MLRVLAAIGCLVWSTTAVADQVILKSGNSIECLVLRADATELYTFFHDGLVVIPRTRVVDYTKRITQPREVGQYRILTLAETLRRVLAWSPNTTVKQIPATVIDSGVFRHIPYKSFVINGSIEMNVYGAPDNPIGLEFGLGDVALSDPGARENMRSWFAKLMRDNEHVRAVNGLKLEADKATRGSMTVETTPATAEDAAGRWWISAYDTAQLDGARASKDELAAITSQHVSAAAKSPPVTQGHDKSRVIGLADESEELLSWDAADQPSGRSVKHVVPPSGPSSALASPPVSSGLFDTRVYVRGYTRKDGTYVRPHTRRR